MAIRMGMVVITVIAMDIMATATDITVIVTGIMESCPCPVAAITITTAQSKPSTIRSIFSYMRGMSTAAW